jgi:hypothetical protein
MPDLLRKRVQKEALAQSFPAISMSDAILIQFLKTLKRSCN